MYKTIGILAHVDAGKTTLSEQILFRCGTIRNAGRVDRGDTVLDHDATERRRGITIYTDLASFSYGGNTYYLLDTPGHIDFFAEMERTLRVLDAAVVVVSCVEGVQAHTEMIWALLRYYGIPTFFFLNKTDRAGADVGRTMEQIRGLFSADAVLLDGGLEDAAEELASLDDVLLDRFFTSGFDAALWRERTAQMASSRRCFICGSGCALSGDGVDRFLSLLDAFTVTRYDVCGDPAAVVFKVRHDADGTRVSFLKLLSGTLRVKDMLNGEKIHEIRAYCGKRFTPVQSAEAGQVCAVTGLFAEVGSVFGAAPSFPKPRMTPLLTAAVEFDASVPMQNVLQIFRTLEAEDPQIGVNVLDSVGQIQVSVMGPIQLEVLAEQCDVRFGLPIRFGDPQILYLETIDAPVYGCGHFEPLRHYAEAHLLLRPLPRGSGVRFSSACSTDELRLNWQRLIETHVYEKKHRGALCGFPLTDVEVVLLTGRAHEKHTEGGDFRQAVYRAVRQALFHAESVILEPFYRFFVRVPSDCIGRVLSDLETMSASYDAPQTVLSETTVSGRCPASEMMHYKQELTAFTKGRGVLRLEFDGYDRCHNADDVIRSHPYAREADVDNTADSVFCSHGAGYTVRWDQAPDMMHCTVDQKLLASFLTK
ncbi:MAG: TetM/TetW/TetO/TetS family tetracycline resistance ribosomal protection protein [Clostridia bacterium]|nr:TetM/TetW/TetO/TetS family tetracycline resistance ribosomal protection protein [Clostridia bacterium]